MLKTIENRAFARKYDNMTVFKYSLHVRNVCLYRIYAYIRSIEKKCHSVIKMSKALIFNGLQGAQNCNISVISCHRGLKTVIAT